MATIKELAEQANIRGGQHITIGSLERFAELIRQDEREANAKLAEITCCKCMDTAEAIRARSNHETT